MSDRSVREHRCFAALTAAACVRGLVWSEQISARCAIHLLQLLMQAAPASVVVPSSTGTRQLLRRTTMMASRRTARVNSARPSVE